MVVVSDLGRRGKREIYFGNSKEFVLVRVLGCLLGWKGNLGSYFGGF